MANIFGIHDMIDGERNLVIRLDIQGDGSGDESVAVAEAALKGCGSFRLDEAYVDLNGFDAYLEWDGATKVPFLQIQDAYIVQEDWRHIGGLVNPKIANYTGNVNFVTVGLGAGETGTAILHFVKKDIP